MTELHAWNLEHTGHTDAGMKELVALKQLRIMRLGQLAGAGLKELAGLEHLQSLDIICRPLAKHHDRLSFRCVVSELDDYLQHRASQDVRRCAVAVFVLVPEDQPQRIAGFYPLASAVIILRELPAELAKALPRCPLVPAVFLARLARDVNFPGVARLPLLDASANRLSITLLGLLLFADSPGDARTQPGSGTTRRRWWPQDRHCVGVR